MLAVYGALSGYFFGFMLNLSFWPFYLDPHSAIAYLPGAAFATNVHHYLVFDATTSLGWDTGRAVTNFVCILLVGPAMLATFRRASRRAAFEAPIVFDRPGDVPAPGRTAGSRPRWHRPLRTDPVTVSTTAMSRSSTTERRRQANV